LFLAQIFCFAAGFSGEIAAGFLQMRRFFLAETPFISG